MDVLATSFGTPTVEALVKRQDDSSGSGTFANSPLYSELSNPFNSTTVSFWLGLFDIASLDY